MTLLLVPVNMASAQDQQSAERAETFWLEAPALVPVQVFLPPNPGTDEPATLIVALHGYGTSAEAWAATARQLANEGFIVAVPEAAHAFLNENGSLGFDWSLYHVGDPKLDVRAYWTLVTGYMPALVRSLEARYHPTDVYLLGHSQGGIAAMLTGIYNNQSFAGVISFGIGAYDPAWFGDPRLATKLESGKHLSIFLLHADDDERVPLAVSKSARNHLRDNGYSVTLRVFHGGHKVPSQELARVATWIRERAKRP